MEFRVVLYGNSLVLEALGASLKKFPHLRVIPLGASSTTAPQELDALRPEVVILDLSLVNTDFAFALLQDRPDLLLIGLDLGGERLVVLSGQQARALTTEDLVRLIISRAELSKDEQASSERAVSRQDQTS